MSKLWSSRILILVTVIYLVGGVGLCFVTYAKGLAARAANPWPQATAIPQHVASINTDTGEELRHQAFELQLQEEKLTVLQKSLEDRAKDIDQRATDLEHLIAGMTIFSGVYTLLLGLFAAFGLKEAKSQADSILGRFEKELGNAKEERAQIAGDFKEARAQVVTDFKEELAKVVTRFDEFKLDIRNEIPSLYGMQKSLGGLLNRIRREIDMTKIWTMAEPYVNMSEEQRQTVLLAELTVASLDYFRLISAGSETSVAAQIFADLANFYSARARVNGKQYNQSDLRRALIYMDRACEMDGKNYRLFSQRAGMTLTSGDKEDAPVTPEQLKKAKEDLELSLTLKPDHPAGLFNLAWIADEQGDTQGATNLLTTFIDQRDNLPIGYRGKRLISAYINRACARARSLTARLSDEETARVVAQVLEDCRAACKEGHTYCEEDYFEKSLERNTDAGVELHLLQTLAPEDLRKLRNREC